MSKRKNFCQTFYKKFAYFLSKYYCIFNRGIRCKLIDNFKKNVLQLHDNLYFLATKLQNYEISLIGSITKDNITYDVNSDGELKIIIK